MQESVAADGHESFATPGDTVERSRGAGVSCRYPTVAILAVHDHAIVSDRNEPIVAPGDAAEVGWGNAFLCFSPPDTVVAERYRAAVSDRDEAPVAPGNTDQAVPIDSSRRLPGIAIAAVNDGVVADGHEAVAAPDDVIEQVGDAEAACLDPAVAVAAMGDGSRISYHNVELAVRSDALQVHAGCSLRGGQPATAAH